MKHALIVAHPNEESFTLAAAGAYRMEAEALGHEVVLRDLYRLGFDPRLQHGEIPRAEGFAPGADVAAERRALAGVDVFAFLYPLWFNAPPAMLVGYVQRVFAMGFGYGPIRQGRNQPLLEGRKLISFTTSGAPEEWLVEEGGLAALTNLFDRHVAGVCGLQPVDHVHFGSILPRMPPGQAEACLGEVRRRVRAAFGG